jgi:hypothetical protein
LVQLQKSPIRPAFELRGTEASGKLTFRISNYLNRITRKPEAGFNASFGGSRSRPGRFRECEFCRAIRYESELRHQLASGRCAGMLPYFLNRNRTKTMQLIPEVDPGELS